MANGSLSDSACTFCWRQIAECPNKMTRQTNVTYCRIRHVKQPTRRDETRGLLLEQAVLAARLGHLRAALSRDCNHTQKYKFSQLFFERRRVCQSMKVDRSLQLHMVGWKVIGLIYALGLGQISHRVSVFSRLVQANATIE